MANRQLALGTISFAICFAAWGLISAFATRFREIYNLSASQTAFLIAAPVLLGSLARIPMGLLTDRWKGRAVFSGLLLFSAIPPLLAPVVSSYSMLLMVGFVLGMAGSSFAVGVGFVSPWFGREKQGTALGVYGLGNAGQSVVVFLGPVLAVRFGWENVFRGVSVLLGGVGRRYSLCLLATRPRRHRRGNWARCLRCFGRERLAWVLSAFYFLTFGGFVAFSIYLPALLRQEFQLTAADAGFRTAGFVLLATGMRPIGGWLSDRIGGARVLSLVFLGIVPFALLLAWPSMLPFTVGALGCAALAGSGKRRGIQTRSAILRRRNRHGHRVSRRHGRPRRILPATPIGVLPRSFRDDLARFRAAGAHGVWAVDRQQSCVPPARSHRHSPQPRR